MNRPGIVGKELLGNEPVEWPKIVKFINFATNYKPPKPKCKSKSEKKNEDSSNK